MTPILVSLSSHPEGSGLQTAVALRRGRPNCSIVALRRGTTAEWADPVVDEMRSYPTWDGLDLETHTAEIHDDLQGGAFYIPSTPGETQWVAETLPNVDGVLAPRSRALERTAGPTPDVTTDLPVSIPDWISATAPVEEIHAFGRRHDWRLWMRTPGGARRPFEHWSHFDALRHEWTREERPRLLIQERIAGAHLLVPFVAYDGDLLDAVLLREIGNDSASVRVENVPNDLSEPLKTEIEAMGWTGGGCVHLIAARNGTHWFDNWRPCFGPEVAPLVQGEMNLPEQLIAAVDGSGQTTPPRSRGAAFVTMPPLDRDAVCSSSPHRAPNPVPSAPARYGSVPSSPSRRIDDDLQDIVHDLPDDWATADTPRSLLLPTRAGERFEAFTEAADRVEQAFEVSTARIGLSIKTNPSDRLLETARATGMLAETIHRDEMEEARRHGFDTDEIIVNGPVQALLPDLDTAPYALFGDAVSDLDDLPFAPANTILGVRTRPPERGPSRFGVDLSDPDTMNRFCDRITALPESVRLGLHLHAPASTLGHTRWWKSVSRVLEWAETIQDRTGRPVQALDLGGGWHADDWLEVFIPGLLEQRARIQEALPDLQTLLLEPGKALSQPLGVVVTRVLDARPHRSEVILDASLAELSNIDYHPHRLLAHTDDRGWHRLPRGNGRLLGRLCMEADILGRDRHVDHLAPGDTVVICDAGAYDASMTYPFGRGHTSTD